MVQNWNTFFSKYNNVRDFVYRQGLYLSKHVSQLVLQAEPDSTFNPPNPFSSPINIKLALK